MADELIGSPIVGGSWTPTSTTSGFDAATLNAQQIIDSFLTQWGLQSLSRTALGYIQQGYSSDAVQFLLQSTPEFAARFPANAERVKQGLAPLSPAEYISTEQSYRQIMAAAGLPAGFYDSPQALSDFIAKDISPSELQSRVTAASTLVNQTDPSDRQALQDYYGIDTGHLVAHFLDSTVAAPILQKQEAAAQIGGSALAQGLAATDRQKAETYVDQGVTQQQAQNAYQKIAQVLPGEQAIAGRFGQTFDQGQAEDEFLGGLASAARKRRQLNAQETSAFRGDTGLTTTLYGNQGRASSLSNTSEGSF